MIGQDPAFAPRRSESSRSQRFLGQHRIVVACSEKFDTRTSCWLFSRRVSAAPSRSAATCMSVIAAATAAKPAIALARSQFTSLRISLVQCALPPVQRVGWRSLRQRNFPTKRQSDTQFERIVVDCQLRKRRIQRGFRAGELAPANGDAPRALCAEAAMRAWPSSCATCSAARYPVSAAPSSPARSGNRGLPEKRQHQERAVARRRRQFGAAGQHIRLPPPDLPYQSARRPPSASPARRKARRRQRGPARIQGGRVPP